jgi:hypothetical protein
MEISPSAGALTTATQYDTAVARKVLDTTREQGQAALELIQSAAAPTNLQANVGTRLNIVG